MATKKTNVFSAWKNELDEITAPDCRVGEDFLLIDDYTVHPALYEPFTPDMTTLLVCREGTVSVNINMTPCIVDAPCSVTILSGQIVQYLEHPGPPPKITAVVMSDKFLVELFRGNNSQVMYNQIFQSPMVRLSEEDIKSFDSYFSLMHSILKRSENQYRLEAMMHLSLTAFYGYFFYQFEEYYAKWDTRAERIYAQFMDLLKANYRSERSVGFYADKICLTPKYLSKTVHDVSGKTVAEWIDEFVVTESKALLKSTEMSVQQISDRLNFSSQSVFGKYFKNATGLSPREYRNKAF